MKSIVRIVALASAVVAFPGFSAEDEALDDELPLELVNMKKKPVQEERFFYAIPKVRRLEGVGEVRKPGSDAWAPAEEGKHYPLGSAFKAGVGAEMQVAMGRDSIVTVKDGSSFATKAQPLGEKSRTLILVQGEFRLKLPRNLPVDRFFVSAPGFVVQGLSGESHYVYKTTGDGDEAVVKCVSDTMRVTGRHFDLPAMRAADEIRIRTSQDVLFTGLFGLAGDSIVNLDQGLVETKDFETNETKITPKALEWKLSPRTAVRIYRCAPKIGANMSVSVLTFTENGMLKNRCTFTENLSALNTGEQGPTTKAEKDEIAKKAAQASQLAGANDTATEEADVDESELDKESDSGEAEKDDSPVIEEKDDFDF